MGSRKKKGFQGLQVMCTDSVDEESSSNISRRPCRSTSISGSEFEISYSSKSSKLKWGFNDPFDFPPDKYHKGLFKATEPFLCNIAPGVLPPYHKFDGEMDPATLHAAVDILTEDLNITEMVFKQGWSEGNVRPLHISIIKGMKLLTRPSQGFKRKLDGDVDVSDFTLDLDVSDFTLDCSTQVSDVTRNASSNESLNVDHEAPPQGEDNVEQGGWTNYRVFVHDKCPLKHPGLSKHVKMQLSTQRLVAVLESKLKEERDAIYQAAAYARYEALQNLENHHVCPLYVIVMAGKTWTYGIMDVRGGIELVQNHISEEAFSDFEQEQKLHREGVGDWEPYTLNDLNSMLKMGTTFLQKNFKNKLGAQYPDKKYIVGDFYISQQWYDLPTCKHSGGAITDHSLLFYKGLMRIVIGDHILKWKPVDVYKAFALRQQILKERKMEALDSWEPTLEELEFEKQQLQEEMEELQEKIQQKK